MNFRFIAVPAKVMFAREYRIPTIILFACVKEKGEYKDI